MESTKTAAPQCAAFHRFRAKFTVGSPRAETCRFGSIWPGSVTGFALLHLLAGLILPVRSVRVQATCERVSPGFLAAAELTYGKLQSHLDAGDGVFRGWPRKLFALSVVMLARLHGAVLDCLEVLKKRRQVRDGVALISSVTIRGSIRRSCMVHSFRDA